MGYTTEFTGIFLFNRQLTTTEKEYINKFSETRRMKRDVSKLVKIFKGEFGLPIIDEISPETQTHIDFLENMGYQVNLTKVKKDRKKENRKPEEIYGLDGAYFVGGRGSFGQDRDDSVIDFNVPPSGQPGLWCQWETNGSHLGWNGSEKFYSYVEWLQYLIEHFFSKWGVILNGEVTWEGEDSNDRGKIIVVDNVVSTKKAKIVYE